MSEETGPAPQVYSISLRLQRTVVEEAYVLVPVRGDVMIPRPGGRGELDADKLVARGIELANRPEVAWLRESGVVQPHPIQQAAPEGYPQTHDWGPRFSRVAPSVWVSDHKRALAFYVDVLGFALDNIDDPPVRAVVTQRAAALHLDLRRERAGTSSVHVIVEGLDEVRERLRGAGLTPGQEPTVQPWGLREMVVTDPDGNVLELAEPVKR